MDTSSVGSCASQKSHNLFDVYLRLRPSLQAGPTDRFLLVEEPLPDSTAPTHITLSPPNDRRRAIEKFGFTQVFEEDATQLDVFHCTGVVPLVEGVLAPHGGDGTDALLATLGVTGSGKTHTILGSRTQRGLTQLAMDVIFRSLGNSILDCASNPSLEASINASDSSEAAIFSASAFLETVYSDPSAPSRPSSRAPTPMIVRSPVPYTPLPLLHSSHQSTRSIWAAFPARGYPDGSGEAHIHSPKSVRIVKREDYLASYSSPSTPLPRSPLRKGCASREGGTSIPPKLRPEQKRLSPQKIAAKHFMESTTSVRQKNTVTKAAAQKGESMGPPPTPRRLLTRPSALPQQPDVSALTVPCDPAAEYAILVSMYEVYNDRIFDLLTPPIKSVATKEYRRRPLLFKSTEFSPDRKVVAGLRKVICGSLQQALMVLEAGLHERRVAGTGSNSVSSRSHGFFCIEVKKRAKNGRRYAAEGGWGGSTLTVVDLAGSERARDAKTAGATLAEAGKINESLMYLGQCLQMQSDSGHKSNVVPYRQCKLTELLFSNSFPSSSQSHSSRRNPQKAVMIVTADPHGDFNATSQILRYSALAREVTVPRIPSITQTILQASTAGPPPPELGSSPMGSPVLHHRPFFPPGSSSGSYTGQPPMASPNIQRTFSPGFGGGGAPGGDSEHRSTMELAALEIARLSEELDYLRQALAAEQAARTEAEAHLLSMEDRMLDLEQAIREDCALEFERRLDIEMARWRANMAVEMERGEEHWGRKIDVFERTVAAGAAAAEGSADFGIAEDAAGSEDKENVLMEDVNEENERLRRDNDVLRREIAAMSPSKRMPLQERSSDAIMMGTAGQHAPAAVETSSPRPSRGGEHGLQRKMEKLRVSDDRASVRSLSSGSPKKMRKLATKRWDSELDGDDMF